MRFAVGASAIVFFQAFIGMTLAKYLNTLPGVIETLQKAALVILSCLAIFFYFQARRKQQNIEGSDRKKGYPFSFGVFLSSLNVLAIPYHCAIASYLSVKDMIRLENPFIPLYSIGASLGTLLVIGGYIRYARTIKKRAAYMARNINYFLSGICIILLIITVIKLF
ncbi:MAG: hypothetical protein DWQ02_00975 [Bacteroidetes bacterium]|nr:MAG: hypothetical protein DWQ02_00975 [Bacteroidota bacterium]